MSTHRSVYRARSACVMLPLPKRATINSIPRFVSPVLLVLPLLFFLFFITHTPCPPLNPPSVHHPQPSQPPPPSKFCDLPGHCIFDLGHNTGQDTTFYLRSPHTRVVAVDANPILVNQSARKFRSAIQADRLTLVAVGLADSVHGNSSATRPFWLNRNNKFSSFLEHLGCRDDWGNVMPPANHTYCHTVHLPVRSCRDLVEEFGTPVYLKIDIEGLDRACVESIATLAPELRPTYLSVENVQPAVVHRLAQLGYDAFKAVNQAKLQLDAEDEMSGYSGPWGEHAVDDITATNWQTKQQMLARLPLNDTIVVGGKVHVAWYDLQARRVS